MTLELTSSYEVGFWFEDKFYVDDGDEEIATLQTGYFSKSFQKPVFSHLEKTENDFEEGPSRGAEFQKAKTLANQLTPVGPA